MNETQTNKNLSNKLLIFDCLDIDSPYESRDMRCCQYCFHIIESDVKKAPIEWICDLPNREAQRRHYANLDNKQKVLIS